MAAPLPAPVAVDQVPVNICARMVEVASQSCQPVVSSTPVSADTTSASMDAVSASLSALSTAFTFGSIILAILAVLVGLAWGKIVARSAEKEAKQVAKECAEHYIVKWMADEAPAIIRKQVDLLNDATIGEGDDAAAADEIGKEAG